jgi:hypothetical protein
MADKYAITTLRESAAERLHDHLTTGPYAFIRTRRQLAEMLNYLAELSDTANQAFTHDISSAGGLYTGLVQRMVQNYGIKELGGKNYKFLVRKNVAAQLDNMDRGRSYEGTSAAALLVQSARDLAWHTCVKDAIAKSGGNVYGLTVPYRVNLAQRAILKHLGLNIDEFEPTYMTEDDKHEINPKFGRLDYRLNPWRLPPGVNEIIKGSKKQNPYVISATKQFIKDEASQFNTNYLMMAPLFSLQRKSVWTPYALPIVLGYHVTQMIVSDIMMQLQGLVSFELLAGVADDASKRLDASAKYIKDEFLKQPLTLDSLLSPDLKNDSSLTEFLSGYPSSLEVMSDIREKIAETIKNSLNRSSGSAAKLRDDTVKDVDALLPGLDSLLDAYDKTLMTTINFSREFMKAILKTNEFHARGAANLVSGLSDAELYLLSGVLPTLEKGEIIDIKPTNEEDKNANKATN